MLGLTQHKEGKATQLNSTFVPQFGLHCCNFYALQTWNRDVMIFFLYIALLDYSFGIITDPKTRLCFYLRLSVSKLALVGLSDSNITQKVIDRF